MVRKKSPSKKPTTRHIKKQRGVDAVHNLPGAFPPRLDLKPHLEAVVGRPTEYRPEFCQKIIMLMAEGKSKATAAVELGVCKETVLTWAKKYPEFLNAVKKAEQLSRRWWEETGRTNIHNKQFNAILYMMNMSNRFGWSRAQDGVTGEEAIAEAVAREAAQEKVIKHEHTHKHEVNLGERTNEHLASVLRILAESGALTTTAEEPVDSEADQIH